MAEYIEKESLLKNFCGFDLTECVKYGNKSKDQACKSYDTLMMYEIADEIENAPSADVAPVVHGTWLLRHIGHGHYRECSVCHATPIYVTNNTNYCPNCGAKMDMEQEEPTNGEYDA